MRPVSMTGALYIPKDAVGGKALDGIRNALTLKHYQLGEEEPEIVEAFFIEGEYIAVPRVFGEEWAEKQGLTIEYELSRGRPAKFPRIPKPRDYQVDFVESLTEMMEVGGDYVVRAHTGFGKTITSLIAAGRRGRTTLILVDQENLLTQWVETLTDPNLFGFKAEDIGIIRGPKDTHAGKAVTIAMVQTVIRREWTDSFRDYFGTIIIDEVHVIGAPTFSKCLMLFSAETRVGISATPKRKDALQKLIDYSLGPVALAADKELKAALVRYVENDSVYSWYANISPKIGRIINEIAEDGSRNLLLAKAAVELHKTGRNILVIGDRIEQLRHLKSLCYYMGIPEEDMGLYTAYSPTYGYEKEPKPKTLPEGYVRGTEYTPVSLNLISRKTPAKVLKEIKETKRIVFATYQKFSKGVDEPRLSAGIDATPRSASDQTRGRTLRENVAGKMIPIWVTVVDFNSYRCLYQFGKRLREYVAGNAEVSKWNIETGELEQCDPDDLSDSVAKRVKYLQTCRIETQSAGRNTIIAPTTASRKSSSHAGRTGKAAGRTRSRG